ncbi:MAG: polysaccharide biosynthesis C-terminal domain-containing protein [Devosia sp.]|nr:polysaccharide biosynthesis C-terminal domain-containing protein [Devosia sp.]
MTGFRRRLLSQSSNIFAGRLFGAGLVFLAQAAIARLWGAEILGEYLLVIAAVNIIAVAMPLGFETIGTYFAAEYRAKGEGRLLRGFMLRAYGHVVLVSLLLFLGGRQLFLFLGEPGRVLEAHWAPVCVMAFANALVLVNGALMVGLKRPYAGFFAESLFRPVLVISAVPIAAMALTPASAFDELIWIIALGLVVIATIHFAYVIAVVRTIPAELPPRPKEARRWWRFALPWVIVALATDFFFDLDVLLLSGLLSRGDLAIFGVCSRIFGLVSFGVVAVYAVNLPDMFESEAVSDRAGFHRKVGDANLVASILAAVLFCGVAAGAPLALMLFGPDFAAGAMPLTVLSLAMLVRALLGPAALVLSIHDRPYATLPAIGLGMGTLVVANLALVPRFGLMGAAIAAVLAQTVWSVALWFTALKTAKVDVSIVPRMREILARRRKLAASKVKG